MREHMKQERFSGMYFFHGAESYVLSRYLELLIKKTVGSRQSPGFSCFDEESITDLPTVSAAVQCISLMPEPRFVLFDHCGIDSSKEVDEGLVRILSDMPEDVTVAFYYTRTEPKKTRREDKADTVRKMVEKFGVVFQADSTDRTDVEKVLLRDVMAANRQITREALDYIIESCDSDLFMLKNEVAKAIALAKDGKITLAEAKLAVNPTFETEVYQFTDAVVRQQKAEAFSILYRLLEQKVENVMLVAAVAKRIQDLYLAKVYSQAGMSVQDIGTKLGIRYRADKTVGIARSKSLEYYEKCFAVLEQTDKLSKSAPIGTKELLVHMTGEMLYA